MWPKTFETRLASWTDLRKRVDDLPIDVALEQINQWWSHVPWQPYYLHWDDLDTWPDPWQLLNDNVYCDVAKALGMLYTISMLERQDMYDAELIYAEDGRNLVQVNQGKYILNWSPDTVVNTIQEVKIKRRLAQSQIKQQYN